jgi:hypothetical protein
MAPHGPLVFSAIEVRKDGNGSLVKGYRTGRDGNTDTLKRWASGDSSC